LIRADHWLERVVVAHRAEPFDSLFIALSRIGTLGFVWVALALVAIWLWRKPVVFPLVLLADFGANGLASALKETIDRPRPHDHPIVFLPHTHSFPSGHSASSFACAATLSRFAPTRRAVVVLYLLAAAIAYSRVYVGVHYPLDVLGGALLGLLVAKALQRLPAALRRLRRAPRAG
jgi:undecaprenyl-diphosphatase